MAEQAQGRPQGRPQDHGGGHGVASRDGLTEGGERKATRGKKGDKGRSDRPPPQQTKEGGATRRSEQCKVGDRPGRQECV